jgi:hypothetical protein
MKTLVKHLFCALFTIFYLIGFVGFGVHKCRIEGTANMFLMMGDVSCESIHEHSHDHHGCSDSRCDSHPFHYTDCSGECCSTDVFVVSSEQDRVQVEDTGLFAQIVAVPLLCDDLTALYSNEAAFPSRDLTPPKAGLLLSALSVWRL